MNKIPGPKNSNFKTRVIRTETAASAKPQKRENTFSQSRDTREDRASRQMKNMNSAQTFPHGR
jgi:hypothetical protein